jgi:outer membrane protein TolC
MMTTQDEPIPTPTRPNDGLRRGCSPFVFRHAWVCLTAALLAATVATAAAAVAETNEPPKRSISLQECFQMALQENLDLRIERINPFITRLDVELARAGYDPNFTMTGDHDYAETGGRFFSFDVTNPPPARTVHLLSDDGVRETDSFTSKINGLGPYGLSYELSGNLTDTRASTHVFGAQTAGQVPSTARILSESVGGSVGLTLTQPLLRNFLTDNTRYSIAIAKNRLKSSELGLQLQIINILTAVEQAYYQLIFARESVQVQAEGLRLAQRLAGDDRKRVQIGMLPRLDEKQSESQVAARQADLSAAQRELAAAQNSLKALITASYRDLHDAFLDPTDRMLAQPHGSNLQDSWEKGLTERPDLRQAKLDLERQGITLRYYKNQRLPELNIRGTYGHGASGDPDREFHDAFGDFASGDKPFWGFGAVFSVPLGNKSARERYRQAKVTSDQLVLALKKKEQSILVEIDEAMNSLHTSYDRVQSTSQARAYAEEALNAEQKKLDSGKSTSFVVLQLQRDLTSARSEEIRALADYNKAVAELYRAEGSTLERKHITLEVK